MVLAVSGNVRELIERNIVHIVIVDVLEDGSELLAVFVELFVVALHFLLILPELILTDSGEQSHDLHIDTDVCKLRL